MLPNVVPTRHRPIRLIRGQFQNGLIQCSTSVQGMPYRVLLIIGWQFEFSAKEHEGHGTISLGNNIYSITVVVNLKAKRRNSSISVLSYFFIYVHLDILTRSIIVFVTFSLNWYLVINTDFVLWISFHLKKTFELILMLKIQYCCSTRSVYVRYCARLRRNYLCVSQ